MAERKGQMQFQFAFDESKYPHPCRLWEGGTKIGHRCYITSSELLYCERCGAALDENKRELAHV